MRQVLAFVVMLLFVATAVPTFYVYQLENTVLDAGPYKRGLQASGLYDQVYALAAPTARQMLRQASAGVLGRADDALLADVSDAELANALRLAVPPAYLRWQAESALDGLAAWFASSEPVPSITFDMTAVKDGLPAAAQELIAAAVNGIPVCKAGQGIELFPACRPAAAEPNLLEQAARRQLAPTLTTVAGSLPAAVSLAQVIQPYPGVLAQMGAVRQRVRSIGILLALLAAISAAWLVLLAALAMRSLPSLLGWLGSALLSAGALSYVPSVVLVGVAGKYASASLSTAGAGLPAEVLTYLPNLTNAVVAALASAMQAQAIAVAGFGGGLLVMGLGVGLVSRIFQRAARRRPEAARSGRTGS